MKKIYELIVIIPARAKSEGLKNKNINKLNNHPLIAYSLAAAKTIKIKSKIIFCSTDSKKILNIAKKYGHSFTDLRPKKISTKYSRDLEFVNHALKLFEKKEILFNFGCILRPTNPIRSSLFINKAIKIFKKKNKFSSLKCLVPTNETPYKMWTLKKNKISPISKIKLHEYYNAPRQILPLTYKQTGSIELFRINNKKKLKSISGKNILGFISTYNESVDIDSMKDLEKAKKILKNNKNFISPS